MLEFLSKAIALIRAAFLCFGTLLAYEYVGLRSAYPHSPNLVWAVIGSGFALLAGVTALSARLSREHRRSMALRLLVFGLAFLSLSGPVLLVLAIPTLLISAVIGIMALPLLHLRSKAALMMFIAL